MCKVLLVDDDVDQRDYLREIITETLPGSTVVESPSLGDALHEVQQQDFDVAVVDLFLTDPPLGQEGLVVLKALYDHDQECFRILVTGKAREWTVKDDANVNAFVTLHNTNRDRRSQLEQALKDAERRHNSTHPRLTRW